MHYKNKELSQKLLYLELGESVAELDTLLETARIETSAFTDLLTDRVDLIPGTKGSGKSALFRMFVDFLPDLLLKHRKVVVAHGVQSPGDPVFHAFTSKFSLLSEDEFISFWCIYLISLAHEQFIKGEPYKEVLSNSTKEIDVFRRACADAKIPEIKSRKSLSDILEWSLHVLSSWRPKLKFTPPDGSGEWEFDLFGQKLEPQPEASDKNHNLPKYVNGVRVALDNVLKSSDLSLWLMVDRLDEIFPRRSQVETKALRGLLRSLRYFASSEIRVKVFLRDDMLDQIVRSDSGFTALTHITVRQADTLKWTEEQILTMIVKRIYANKTLASFFDVNKERLEANGEYRTECFYKIFPPTVFRGPKQSPTIRWIYNRCADARGVVTPRDILDLLIRAKQKQQDLYAADPEGTSEVLISSEAIQYGLEELSKRKRLTYLQAEFPHYWNYLEKFIGGKADYTLDALDALLGSNHRMIIGELIAIGFLSLGKKRGVEVYSIPILYRHGMDISQGRI